MKKITNLILIITFMLVGGLLGTTSVNAENYPEYIKIGGKTLNSETPYYKVTRYESYSTAEAIEDCDLGDGSCMAYYDSTKGELILHNYDYSSEINNELENTDIKIKLIGTNIIKSANSDIAIANKSGTITITSEDNASLAIQFPEGYRENAIGITNLDSSNNNIIIEGNANVSIFVTTKNVSDKTREVIGIKNSNGSVNIVDDAKLTINGSYGSKETSQDKLYGIYANETNINTNSNVKVTGSSEFRGAIYGNLNLVKFNKIELDGPISLKVSDYANVKSTDIDKFLFAFENGDKFKPLTITNDDKLSGILLYNAEQYEYYISTIHSKLVLANDISHTSTNQASSNCDDHEIDFYHDGIYCASFLNVGNDKTLDLNGHTLTVEVLNLRFSNNATFTIKDSSDEKTGTLAIPSNGYGTFNITDNLNSSNGKEYNLVFDGGNYSYGDSFCVYNYCTQSFINAKKLYKGTLNIKYKNNPVFTNNGQYGELFITRDANVDMNAESLTYKHNGNKDYTGLGTSEDEYFGSKTYADLINKYTTDALINNNPIKPTQNLNWVLDNLIEGENIIVIKPKTKPYDIEIAEISGITDKKYTGKAITQNINVMYNNITLVENEDYKVTYTNNIDAGTATVIITGMGDYRGASIKTFKINKQCISNVSSISWDGNNIYNGKQQKQNIKIIDNGTTLREGIDYEVSYLNNVNAGTASFTIKGIGKYSCTDTHTFKIDKAKNSMTLKTVRSKIKYKKLKKKKQIIAPITVTKAQGAVTYTKLSGNKKIKIDTKTGKITVKKKTKKGNYSVKVKISAAGNKNYFAATKTVTIVIRVK